MGTPFDQLAVSCRQHRAGLSAVENNDWRRRAQFVVALLFGLHPLHVESVAWVAERKDVLSTFFGLLTLLAYARYAQGDKWQVTSGRNRKSPRTCPVTCHATAGRSPGEGWSRSLFYWLGVVLLRPRPDVKAHAGHLPFVLLLLDYWPLDRLGNNGVSGAWWLRRRLFLRWRQPQASSRFWLNEAAAPCKLWPVCL